MVLSYDEVGDLLDEIAEDFPPAFFEQLNGGILLEEEALPDPQFPPGEMYILGQYCQDMTGRSIVLYYGSFVELYSHRGRMAWKRELFKTLAHEFTHHLEHLGGLHALDDKDEAYLARAMEKYRDDPRDDH